MARKSFYIHYYDPECKPLVYHLYYCDLPVERRLLPEGARRITAENALRLAVSERMCRRRHRPYAGDSDAAVYPIAYPGTREELEADPGYILDNWIWVPVKNEE